MSCSFWSYSVLRVSVGTSLQGLLADQTAVHTAMAPSGVGVKAWKGWGGVVYRLGWFVYVCVCVSTGVSLQG